MSLVFGYHVGQERLYGRKIAKKVDIEDLPQPIIRCLEYTMSLCNAGIVHQNRWGAYCRSDTFGGRIDSGRIGYVACEEFNVCI